MTRLVEAAAVTVLAVLCAVYAIAAAILALVCIAAVWGGAELSGWQG